MMGSDYTLADLAEDSGTSSGSDSGGEATGEWVNNLVDKLDEKGVLDQLIASQMGGGGGNSKPAPNPEPNPEPDSGGTMDAEQLKQFMLELYDNSERIPGVSDDPKLSELIQLVDEKEGLADQMLQEHL